ncbi:MAG: AAA family ATPase [Pirellula sp.]|nr:AAA family ATPase [Pirellula sp.]
MQLTIATIVTTRRVEGQSQYFVQTVGKPRVSAADVLLKAALQKLNNACRKHLQKWIEKGKSRELAAWLYDPNAQYRMFKQLITLRDRTVRVKTLMHVQENELGRIGLFPLLDAPPFQIQPTASIEERAAEVLTAWCEEKLKQDGVLQLESLVLTGEAWIEPVDMSFDGGATKKKKKGGMIAALLGQTAVDGASALHRVGRCLDATVEAQSELFHRHKEVDRLEQILKLERRQGVLLLGPSGVGKSAILAEVVRRRVAAKPVSKKHLKQVWLVSPARVISGMSYLGQWEQRWLAILKESARRDHVLVFDDPLGLYTAGKTRDSDMCLADVLKSFMAENPLRCVFEMTPQALSILRRKDRSVVDPMLPITVDAMDETQSMQTMIDVIGQIESRSHCFFHPGLLPKMIEYSSMLAPHVALPGKLIDLARGLERQALAGASRSTDKSTEGFASEEEENANPRRSYPLSGFDLDRFVQERTGLRLALRKGTADLATLRMALANRIRGQSAAVEVMARFAIRSLYGMQPLDRPLGVFLFMGPTGVGKTESAKALTKLLFHDESRLVRIDMNEISSSQAAEELIGTLENPDGRLPSAIRRSPNCVLLLDEIEKAHPDVLDYLLQVLGEGRLSDARGRLVDFRNAFIIMTSNLGAKDAGSHLGYDNAVPGEVSRVLGTVYQRAAKQHFRPEFLNRIDEVVVFHRLEREVMGGIVKQQLESLMQRDGLSRRRIFLKIENEATEWIVNRGYDPALGARAIKRCVEREVAQPLADHFAGQKVDNPSWVRLRLDSEPAIASKLVCDAKELTVLSAPETSSTALSMTDFLDQMKGELGKLRIALKARDQHSERPLPQVDYYACHGCLGEADELWKEVVEQVRMSRETSLKPIQQSIKQTPSKAVFRNVFAKQDTRDRLISELSMAEMINDLSPPNPSISQEQQWQRVLCRKIALAQRMIDFVESPKRWFIRAKFLNMDPELEADQIPDMRTMCSQRNDDVIPLAMNFFVTHHVLVNLKTLLSSLQYDVSEVSPYACFIAEGTSVYGILEPLLGTYQVSGEYGFDRLITLQACPTKEHETVAQVMADDTTLAMLDNPTNGEPTIESTGPNDWTTIRGEFNGIWLDYQTQTRTKLYDSREWQAWYLDLIAHATSGNRN